MPKLKTHKGLRWRVRLTRRGKIIAHRAGRRHLMQGKPAFRAKRLRRAKALSSKSSGRLPQLLPYD